jgi:hypothetical protein
MHVEAPPDLPPVLIAPARDAPRDKPMPFDRPAIETLSAEPTLRFAWHRFEAIDLLGSDPRRVILLSPSHPLRAQAESCISEVYARMFRARNLAFPSTLLALLDGAGRPLCAAGLRTAAEGFFSEIYLDAPIDRLLSERSGRAVGRQAILEVTTLASRSVEASPVFLRRLALFGRCAGFEWSFFTATARLQRLLSRLGMPLVELSPADPRRLSGAEQWGSYYTHSPRVCAVDDRWLYRGSRPTDA